VRFIACLLLVARFGWPMASDVAVAAAAAVAIALASDESIPVVPDASDHDESPPAVDDTATIDDEQYLFVPRLFAAAESYDSDALEEEVEDELLMRMYTGQLTAEPEQELPDKVGVKRPRPEEVDVDELEDDTSHPAKRRSLVHEYNKPTTSQQATNNMI
jgi:hypothetical protein